MTERIDPQRGPSPVRWATMQRLRRGVHLRPVDGTRDRDAREHRTMALVRALTSYLTGEQDDRDDALTGLGEGIERVRETVVTGLAVLQTELHATRDEQSRRSALLGAQLAELSAQRRGDWTEQQSDGAGAGAADLDPQAPGRIQELERMLAATQEQLSLMAEGRAARPGDQRTARSDGWTLTINGRAGRWLQLGGVAVVAILVSLVSLVASGIVTPSRVGVPFSGSDLMQLLAIAVFMSLLVQTWASRRHEQWPEPRRHRPLTRRVLSLHSVVARQSGSPVAAQHGEHAGDTCQDL